MTELTGEHGRHELKSEDGEGEMVGKRVLVTGAASNIGRAIALEFATVGARVAVVDRDRENAERVVAEARALGASEAIAQIGDLTEADAVAGIVASVVEQWSGLDVLVNNAGVALPDFFSKQSTDQIRLLVEANLYPALFVTQAALPSMVKSGGSIIFISSDAAYGEARNAVYGAAKAGLIAFARALAREHGRDQIRVNAVAPGLVPPSDSTATGDQSFWRTTNGDGPIPEDVMSVIERGIPLRRITRAEDIARAVLFLASDRHARQITGQVLAVNGGYSMH